MIFLPLCICVLEPKHFSSLNFWPVFGLTWEESCQSSSTLLYTVPYTCTVYRMPRDSPGVKIKHSDSVWISKWIHSHSDFTRQREAIEEEDCLLEWPLVRLLNEPTSCPLTLLCERRQRGGQGEARRRREDKDIIISYWVGWCDVSQHNMTYSSNGWH